MITKDDIAAFKAAGSVTFHHYKGTSYIRLHTDKAFSDDTPIYTAREQRLFPQTDVGRDRSRQIDTGHQIYGYKIDAGVWDDTSDPGCSAFYMFHFHSPELRTIADLLRAGDVLTLNWSADNNNDNHSEAGFHCDKLRLTVTRGDKVMTFYIASQGGPDNSARMISRYGR